MNRIHRRPRRRACEKFGRHFAPESTEGKTQEPKAEAAAEASDVTPTESSETSVEGSDASNEPSDAPEISPTAAPETKGGEAE